MAEEDADEPGFYYMSEHAETWAGDALYRALAKPAPRQDGRRSEIAVVPRWDSMLAASQAGRALKRKRSAELVTVQDRIAREYFVAKRLCHVEQQQVVHGWARDWAREKYLE